jgi:hypothetical protein
MLTFGEATRVFMGTALSIVPSFPISISDWAGHVSVLSGPRR